MLVRNLTHPTLDLDREMVDSSRAAQIAAVNKKSKKEWPD